MKYKYFYYSIILLFGLIASAILIQQLLTDEYSDSTSVKAFYLIDGYDRNVTFEEIPQRIISVAPSATEMIFALGAGEKVIAVDPSSNYPSETENLTKIANFPNIDLETILTLNPDLVFGAGITSQDDVDTLESQGIKTFILAPFNIEEVLEDIEKVGLITNHNEKATFLVNSLQNRIDVVNKSVNALTIRPKIYLEFASDPLYTFGEGTYGHDLINLAGAVNIAENALGLYPQIDNEFVIINNPDIIFYTEGSWTTTNVSSISTRVGWEAISAVKNGMIFPINEDWVSRGGPRIIDGLEAIHSKVQDVAIINSPSTKGIVTFHMVDILGLIPVLAVIAIRRLRSQ